ncbi:unnamed protein product [Soboliphyme baturini]|uniref:Uncharacterized protein n=1 Tax=Soboliphyme baturini TaxID=241478 RepID=A0A183J1S8_9BILA|nr:unnamed protein product [Soboliphyme baturini]
MFTRSLAVEDDFFLLNDSFRRTSDSLRGSAAGPLIATLNKLTEASRGSVCLTAAAVPTIAPAVVPLPARVQCFRCISHTLVC